MVRGNLLAGLTRDEAYSNCRVKINPQTGEVIEAVVANRPIFRTAAVEAREGAKKRKRSLPNELWEMEEASTAWLERLERREADSRRRSAQRAKKKLYELALCNDFDVFFTLTLSPEEVDRYDYKQCVKVLETWLDNRVRRKALKYIIVPELHRDGAVHFHGLANGTGLLLQEARLNGKRIRKRMGKVQYTVVDWKKGFSNAVFLDGEYGAVCKYISKYVTKAVDGKGTIGGRYYLHGGALAQPACKFFSADYESLSGLGYDVEIEDAGLVLKYLPPEVIEDALKDREMRLG